MLDALCRSMRCCEGAMVQPKTRNRIVDALLALAAERPWEEVTLRGARRARRGDARRPARRL